jgi:hypothetical protein
VIVAVVEVDTADVVTVKVAVVLPAATVTDVGGTAAEELLLNDTDAPPVGAGPVSVTVPLELDPPVTVFGERLRELRAGGATVRLAVFVAPP